MAKDRQVSHGSFHKGGECGDGAVHHSCGQVWGVEAKSEEGLLHSCCFRIVLPLVHIVCVGSPGVRGGCLESLAQLCWEPSE